ncbi:MAG TPA: hypothetical protein PLR25_25460 [Planctomycetaceae bacterium]|nr:hypothetical protein [Planctomycetaceae bacterium]
MLKIARSQWLGKAMVFVVIAVVVYLFWTDTWNARQLQDLLQKTPFQQEESSATSTEFVREE